MELEVIDICESGEEGGEGLELGRAKEDTEGERKLVAVLGGGQLSVRGTQLESPRD